MTAIYSFNGILGIVYIITLFAVRKTPSDHRFRWLATAELIMMIAAVTSIFVPPLVRNFLVPFFLLPGIFIFLLIQKTRRHLAQTEQESAFLAEVEAGQS